MAVKDLHPELGSGWTVKVRVVNKQGKRSYDNAKGSGLMFKFTVIDSNKNEINVVAFGKACDKYSDAIKVGEVYTISKARLKLSKRQFTNVNHAFEIHLGDYSVICNANDKTNEIQRYSFDFVEIGELLFAEVGCHYDVAGVVLLVGDLVQKQNQRRRAIVVADHSNYSVQLTLWGDAAKESITQGQIVCCKSAKLSTFGGHSLSCSTHLISLSEGFEHLTKLTKWWNNDYIPEHVTALTSYKMKHDIKFSVCISIVLSACVPLFVLLIYLWFCIFFIFCDDC